MQLDLDHCSILRAAAKGTACSEQGSQFNLRAADMKAAELVAFQSRPSSSLWLSFLREEHFGSYTADLLLVRGE